jgi:hypothetical protein
MDRSDDKPLAMAGLDAELAEIARIRPVKQIQVSPEYAAFLENELDSDGYARSLVSACRDRVERPAAARPDATPARGSAPADAGHPAPVPPEYRRFLDEEISSREYAVALARYARLEEQFRSPSSRGRGDPDPLRFPAARILAWLGLVILYVVASLMSVVVVPYGVARGLELAPAAREWTVSLVGAVLLAVTVIAASSSTLRGWVQSPVFWEDR